MKMSFEDELEEGVTTHEDMIFMLVRRIEALEEKVREMEKKL